MAPIVLRIDFVSDVACPWCAIGLANLEQALARLEDLIHAEIHLQPFELNPQLPIEGEDASEHLMRKYGIDEAQLAVNRATIRERAAASGVTINAGPDSRVYNTFDAHRLLHWAGLQDRTLALALKRALFRAYFTEGENVADHAVLGRIVADAGLDAAAARRMLASDAHADDVRTLERQFQQAGIHSVPATIINEMFIISGGQPPEAFEHVLREIATRASAA